jgi:hypothetical protein
MELTGCGPIEAAKALAEHKEVWLAVDALMTKPVVSGEKYIPAKPMVDAGQTDEQKERCTRGRWLQDKVNAVFSVAHSKIQSPPVHEALEGLPDSTEAVASVPTLPPLPPSPPASPQGIGERSPLPALQFADLPQTSSSPQYALGTAPTVSHMPPGHPAPEPLPPTLT